MSTKPRPTPETDAAKRHKHNVMLPNEVVPAFVCERLERQRDELLAAMERAHQKLCAYVGVCSGDKELTDTVLPMAEAAIAAVKGGKL